MMDNTTYRKSKVGAADPLSPGISADCRGIFSPSGGNRPLAAVGEVADLLNRCPQMLLRVGRDSAMRADVVC
jgi:hypothetical protein